MKKRDARLPCTQVLSSPPMVVNGAFAPLPCKHDRKGRERLLKVAWAEQALIPGECRIEIVHQVLRKHVRISGRERVERLRRNGVEQRIDRVGVGGLQAGVGLKAKPGGVVRVDVVVDAGRLHLLVVVAGMRNALPIGAAVSVRRIARRPQLPSELNGQPRTARGVPLVLPYSENIFW